MSDVKQRPIANAVNASDWLVVQGDEAGLGDEKRSSILNIQARSPRIIRNILSPSLRFLDTATLSGTAAKTASKSTNQNGVKNGLLALDSGSAGRAFSSVTVTLTAGVWYALSIDFDGMSGMTTGSNCGIQLKTAGTAVIDNSSGDITEQKLAAGGNGRYCIIFRSILGGTTTFRIGVGMSSNAASKLMTIHSLQLEELSENGSMCAGEYVYPGWSSAFNYINPHAMDANGKLIIPATLRVPFVTKPYSHILAVGDSRIDEVANIAAQLDTILKNNNAGTCIWHAKGGWSTSNQIGPTTVNDANMSSAISATFENAITGSLIVRTYSTAGDEQIGDNQSGFNYDTLLVCDFGYNDINADPVNGAVTALANIITMCDRADALGMRIILSDNNPFKAHASYSAQKLTLVKTLNAALQNLAAERGYLFVRMYEKLSDSTDLDKLSDGAGTTTNYSQDALHLNDVGSTLYAQAIYNAIAASL